MTPTDRARAYLAKCPPAISGQAGHNETFKVACALVHGFALDASDALALLGEYNQGCQPPWNERELRHKIESAQGHTGHEKPRGHLLGPTFRYTRTLVSSESSKLPAANLSAPAQKQARKAHTAAISAAPLPKPVDDPTRKLILAAFNDGENVCIAQEEISEDGRGRPKDSGATLTRAEWIARLTAVSGDPNKIWSSMERAGAYIRINPLKPGGSSDSDVTAFRHVLLESDKVSIEDQWRLISGSNIPCTAVLHSGNQSLHAWVRVDARDDREYRERRDFVFEYFKDHGIDPKNKNPSRLSRLPGMVRGAGRQELLALNIGAPTWQEWITTEGEGLPKIQDACDLLEFEIPEPNSIIAGVLHQGHILVLGGGSKTYKSWGLIDMGVSVASGSKWFNWECPQGLVLYLNFEIDEYHFRKRLGWIAEAKQVNLKRDSFHIWNLRGHAAPYDEIIPGIKKHINGRKYSLIIPDPLYMMLGNADENKAGDMAKLMNAIGGLSVHSGAAIAIGAHFSKGNQAGKESIDRISGSGVFARAPDTILMLTQHEEKDAFTVDVTLRNFKGIDPFVVKWDFPMLRVDNTGLDPTRLKQVAGKQPGHSMLVLLSPIRGTTIDNPISVSDWARAANVKRPTLNGYTEEMRKRGWIATAGEGTKARKYITAKGIEALALLDGKELVEGINKA